MRKTQFADTAPEVRGHIEVGDAFDLADTLETASVDLICTSPPYWGLRTYGQDYRHDVLERHLSRGRGIADIPTYDEYRAYGGALGLEPTPEWYVAHLVELIDLLDPALRADGSIWINLGDTYFARWSSIRASGRQGLKPGSRERRRSPAGGYRHDKQLLMIPARFAIAMQDAGWILRNDLIWAKPHPAPRPETDRLRLSHEHFFHFVRRQPSRRPTYYYDLGDAEPGARDVVTVSPAKGSGGHSATFPAELIDPRIKTSCPPRGTVLDPFCGTGTAVARAVSLRRNAIGFELSGDFAKTAMDALASATPETNGLGSANVKDSA